MELSWERPEEEWRSVSHLALGGWLAFYTLFRLHAATNQSGFLVLDNVNLVAHEAGHLFFRWFGYTATILGGTLGELLVPLLIAGYFFWRRETAGTAFAAFWFFENFLYIGTYMADARTLALPLVGDRKSTRLNSSHSQISYAVFCLKKKKNRLRPSVRAPRVLHWRR